MVRSLKRNTWNHRVAETSQHTQNADLTQTDKHSGSVQPPGQILVGKRSCVSIMSGRNKGNCKVARQSRTTWEAGL